MSYLSVALTSLGLKQVRTEDAYVAAETKGVASTVSGHNLGITGRLNMM